MSQDTNETNLNAGQPSAAATGSETVWKTLSVVAIVALLTGVAMQLADGKPKELVLFGCVLILVASFMKPKRKSPNSEVSEAGR